MLHHAAGVLKISHSGLGVRGTCKIAPEVMRVFAWTDTLPARVLSDIVSDASIRKYLRVFDSYLNTLPDSFL